MNKSQKPKTCGHQQMSEGRAKVTDRFGKHVKYSISNDFGIDIDDMATLRETPDAVVRQ